VVKHLTLTRVQSYSLTVIFVLSSNCFDTTCEKIDILGRDWQCRNHAAYEGGSDGLYIKNPSLLQMMIWLAKTEKPLGKSNKSIPRKAKLKKRKWKIMSEARDRKMKRERRFEMQKAEKVLRACRSRRGYELFQEPEKKKQK